MSLKACSADATHQDMMAANSRPSWTRRHTISIPGWRRPSAPDQAPGGIHTKDGISGSLVDAVEFAADHVIDDEFTEPLDLLAETGTGDGIDPLEITPVAARH